jgi:exodeoxyribonuclease VII large subunit
LAYFLQQHFDNNAVQLQQYQDIVISRAKEQLRSEQTVLQLITQKIRTKSSQKLDKEKYLLTTLQQDLSRKSRSLLQSNKQRQLQLIKEVQMLSFKSISHQQHKLLHFDKVRKSLVQRQLSSERNRQKHLGEKIALLSPVNLLKKGYSISLFNGKPISNLQALKAGDQIQTQLLGGEIESTIIKIKDNGKRKP